MVSTILNTSTDLDDVPPPERLRMTYDEYVDWYDRDAGRRGEWVDGEVIVFVSTTYRHERILIFIAAVLTNIVLRLRLGEVLGDEYELRTREGSTRLPDLKVILREHEERITDRRLVGAADVVFEIISPDSVNRDRHIKRDEYETAGIPEYWVIDPREGKESVELFVLDNDRRYVSMRPDAEGRYRSTVVPGFWVDPTWLSANELPDSIDLALEMLRQDPPNLEA